MKNLRLLVFTLLLLALPVILIAAALLLPAQYGETFLGALPDKLERLEKTESPRIILVGGSSVPFGIRSDLVEQQLPGWQVVNFGLYAQLGTPVMLDFLEENLKPGDIVILCPEQNRQALSPFYAAESLWQAVDGNFRLLFQLSPARLEKMAAAFPVFAGKKIGYYFTGSPAPTDIYARASFNAWGDIESEARRANIMAGGYDPNQTISFEKDLISEDFVEILNNFNALAAKKGAAVYYRFGPMNEAAIVGDATADAFYDALRSRLDFPILGDPNRSILDSGWFYDTNFHLNASGATVFTKGLIEDLKLLLQDTSVTDIPLPPLPAPEVSGPISGDNSCLDCFTYEETATGWVITGLTDKGKTAQNLIVPVSRDGKPVEAVDKAVFVNQTHLRQITVQANIGVLYDGMFSGCAGLRRLILTAAPTAYTAGSGLRDGADFLIQVPAGQIDAYRRHYTWQHYSSYMVPADQANSTHAQQ